MASTEPTSVATQGRRELTPAQKTRHTLEQRKEEFAAALAGRIDPEAFLRVAFTTITKSPKLLEATTSSLMMALLEAASLGLMPNGVMGEAYLVPFNNKLKGPDGKDLYIDGKPQWEVQAQFIPGYRGLIKLARQSGVVRNVVARAVWKDELFEVEYGLDERLVHTPNLGRTTEDPRQITHVYAVAHFHDGGAPQFDVMLRGAVEKIRARSKAKDNGPWVTDWEAMALKTVVRRLFKMLPSSDVNLARAIEADNREYEREEVERRSSAADLERRLVAVQPGALALPPEAPAPLDAWEPGDDFPDPVPAGDAAAVLDAVGLTGEGPAPAPHPRTAFIAALDLCTPDGEGAATKVARDKIKAAAAGLELGEEDRERALHVAGHEKLGRAQGEELARLATLALAESALAAGGDGGLFGEGS